MSQGLVESRRSFLRRAALLSSASAAANLASGCRTGTSRRQYGNTWFQTRGVVLVPEDLSLTHWPERASAAGLTTIGIHHQNSPAAVVAFIQSDAGQRFLEACRRSGLQVEYELHAMKELLPRQLFTKSPSFFRMNNHGERTADANCCISSSGAIELICANAIELAEKLRSTTNRYFFWGDDGQPGCLCPKCAALPQPDQALLLENHILEALRSRFPSAELAHLAYDKTLPPPRLIKPASGIFLEYAPIRRRYDRPYADQQRDANAEDTLSLLDENLNVFPRETAQVIEYWLDVSRFSRWQRPAVELPWRRDVLAADLETYAARGVRHVTSFAVWVDADYVSRFGEPQFIPEYGQALKSVRR